MLPRHAEAASVRNAHRATRICNLIGRALQPVDEQGSESSARQRVRPIAARAEAPVEYAQSILRELWPSRDARHSRTQVLLAAVGAEATALIKTRLVRLPDELAKHQQVPLTIACPPTFAYDVDDA